MHEVLVNPLGGLSLPRKSVVSLTDRPDMTLVVYRDRKTTIQHQQQTFPCTCTEASMDPRNVEIKSPRPSYFMLTCLGIPRHDDKKYVNMST